MTMSSSAIRSSTVNSPWSATISVRRSSPNCSTTSAISSLRMVIRLGARGEDALELLDRGADLLQLGLQLLDLEAGELGEAHVEDRVALLLAQAEPLPELGIRLGRVVRAPDDLDHLVDVVDGDLEALEDVLPRLRGVEVELGAADDDLVAVLDVVLEHLLQVHDLGRALVERQHDHAEGGLHRGVLVELVQHHVGDGIALELDDHPHAVLVGLVVHPADALDLLLASPARRWP